MHRQSLVEYGQPLQPTEAATPKPQGSEVLLRVSHCGVCHSDIHLQDGYFDLGGGQKLDVRAGRQLPFTFGHEIAGVVEAIGPDAQGVAKGQRYAAYPWIGCGKCGLCARGDEHMCNAPRVLGVTVDGGYATHVLVPHPRYLLDVEGIAPEIAGALMCSGLTGYGAIKKAVGFLRAGPILIVGLGGVGMMGLQFARALTDKPIFVADIDKGKRDAALKLGAAEAFDPADAGARKAIAKASGGGVGAAVDFAGSDKSLAFAQATVAKGGAAIVVGCSAAASRCRCRCSRCARSPSWAATSARPRRRARCCISSSPARSPPFPSSCVRSAKPAARSMICARARSWAAWWLPRNEVST